MGNETSRHGLPPAEAFRMILAQQFLTVKLQVYENEYETMRSLIQGRPACLRNRCDDMFKDWIKKTADLISNEDRIRLSNECREKGNRLFTAQLGERDVIGACHLYTEAICSAPMDSEKLALAHANRAATLQELGYFQQAYDDCVCALEKGYPERLRHKVVMRQAHCARGLGDAKLLKLHLVQLERLQLNANQMQLVGELHTALQGMEEREENANADPEKEGSKNEATDLHRETTKIVKSTGLTGRYMVATQPIGANELIFRDYAVSFVPERIGQKICQQCAAMLLIPFPCARCNNQVFYCSLRCRDQHAAAHALECPAYKYGLFEQIDAVAHLALNVLLDGLPEVLHFLRFKQNARALWSALTNENSSELPCEQLKPAQLKKGRGSIIASKTLQYAQSLRMCSQLDSMDREEVIYHALVSQMLVFYLREFTNFYDKLETSASRSDWELITGALILRHTGQLMVNARLTVSPGPLIGDEMKNSPLFMDKIWQSPFHIKRGHLHLLSGMHQMMLANFPYFNNCNHSCEPSFRTKFSGRYINTYANRSLCVGEEITNSYTLDCYRECKMDERRVFLKRYNFECSCDKCKRPNPDEDYENFHRYRCENSKCGRIFVPHLPRAENLHWWHSEDDDVLFETPIKCIFCGAVQRCGDAKKIMQLLHRVRNPSARFLIYKHFEELHKWYIDSHELKNWIATRIIPSFLEEHDGSPLSDAEFAELVKIYKYASNAAAEQCGKNSLYCTLYSTILWDFIALGKYKCSRAEMNDMLKSLEIISEEYRKVFLNYYKDFIEPLLE